jgi:hypothetical protein
MFQGIVLVQHLTSIIFFHSLSVTVIAARCSTSIIAFVVLNNVNISYFLQQMTSDCHNIFTDHSIIFCGNEIKSSFCCIFYGNVCFSNSECVCQSVSLFPSLEVYLYSRDKEILFRIDLFHINYIKE